MRPSRYGTDQQQDQDDQQYGSQGHDEFLTVVDMRAPAGDAHLARPFPALHNYRPGSRNGSSDYFFTRENAKARQCRAFSCAEGEPQNGMSSSKLS